jgi:hypothetical protein
MQPWRQYVVFEDQQNGIRLGTVSLKYYDAHIVDLPQSVAFATRLKSARA